MSDSDGTKPPSERWLDPCKISRPSPPALLAALLAILAVLVLLDIAAWVSAREAADRFSLDGEITVATWWASVQLLLLASLFAIVGRSEAGVGRGKAAWTLYVGTAVAVSFSVDETAAFHEAISQTFTARGIFSTSGSALGTWAVVYLIVALGILIITFPGIASLLSTHRTDTVLVALGAAVFVLGGVVVEGIDSFLGPHGEVIIEEILEFSGIAIMVWATYRMLGTREIRVRVR